MEVRETALQVFMQQQRLTLLLRALYIMRSLLALLQQYVGKGVAYEPDEPGRWVCDFLELPHTRLDIVLDAERSKAFQQLFADITLHNKATQIQLSCTILLDCSSSTTIAQMTLDAVLKAKPDKEGASPVWRYTELEPEELQSVQLAAEKSVCAVRHTSTSIHLSCDTAAAYCDVPHCCQPGLTPAQAREGAAA
eukprot:8087-Heterococcus_DN1.PRE.1